MKLISWLKVGKNYRLYFRIIFSCFAVMLSFLCSFAAFLPAHDANSSELIAVEMADENIITTEYRDANGKITFASDKCFASVKRIYNDIGQVVEEYYFDEKGNPQKQSSGQYGLSKEYNDSGQNNIVTFLDADGNPMMSTSGYSTVVRIFNDRNQVIKEQYYDISQNKTSISDGRFGTTYYYDSYGRQVKTVFIDEKDQPIVNNFGIASLIRTFNSDGSIDTEFYLDINNKPVEVNGAYGIKRVGNFRLDVNKKGEILISQSNIVRNFPWIIIVFGAILALLVIFLPLKWGVVLIVIYMAFIVFQTLINRETGGGLKLTPFWSYSQFFSSYSLRLEILNNIWLFVPFGAGLYSLLHKGQAVKEIQRKQDAQGGRKNTEKKTIKPGIIVILVSMIFSIIIEASQYIFSLGLCEIDDVISNTLGSAIGVMMAASLLEIKEAYLNKRQNKTSVIDSNQVVR